MNQTVFLSYRRDPIGKPLARLIQAALKQAGYDVFLDVTGLDSGTWERQIRDEVMHRAHFLLLLTPGALDRCSDPRDAVRREFELARSTGRNIVPLREESVDLTAMKAASPPSMMAVFDYQVADIRHSSFESDLETLLARFIPPHKAPPPFEPRVMAFRADVSRIDRYAPAELIGRDAELARLSDAWERARHAQSPRPHVITFVALGGEGKTSVVARWIATMAANDWPDCEAAFAWSFYSQGTREQMSASSDLFLKEALTFFGDPEIAVSTQTAYDKGRRLAQIVGERRALLILDGLEPLQYAPTSPQPGVLKDQGISALLKGLAANHHGLCIVTTRYSVTDLRNFWQTTAPEIKLTRLSVDAGVALLTALGVHGARKDLAALVEDVNGHALTINLLGAFLRDAHGGDVRKRDLVRLREADAEEQSGHAFRVMDAYVQWMAPRAALAASGAGLPASDAIASADGERQLAVLRLLGLYDRPAPADSLIALRQPPAIPELTEALAGISDVQWNLALSRLETAGLVTVNRDAAGALISLDAHPLVREYFAERLRTHQLAAWRQGNQRIYEHLCATTVDKPNATLEDLQPLYEAVAHGCQAGLYEEARRKVYYAFFGGTNPTAPSRSARSARTSVRSPASSSDPGARCGRHLTLGRRAGL